MFNNKTYSEILKEVSESQIATYKLLQWLRNSKKYSKHFKDFWVFVPNPDKISKNNGYIARFGAGEDGAGLNCVWDPTDASDSLGVFITKVMK